MNIKELKRDLSENKYVRCVFYPYRAYKKYRLRNSYRRSGYPEKMKKYHDVHKGEKCYIIGNGPSLTVEDLELIKNNVSIAANKIYSIFDKTEWRPTYYICEDTLSVVEEIAGDIDKIDAKGIFLNWVVRDKIGEKEEIVYGLMNPYYVVNIWDYKNVYVSEECSRGFGWAGTVTFTAIQLAIYMGFKEIYLLGVDFSYPYYRDRKGKRHCTDMKAAHFAGGGYPWVNYFNKTTNERGYIIAREYCEKHGIVIKNATRGGKLEVFERVELEMTVSLGSEKNK